MRTMFANGTRQRKAKRQPRDQAAKKQQQRRAQLANKREWMGYYQSHTFPIANAEVVGLVAFGCGVLFAVVGILVLVVLFGIADDPGVFRVF